MQYDFAVIGGDRRQIYLANDLKNRRYRVIVYGVEDQDLDLGCRRGESLSEAVRNAECIIGPVVFSKDREFVTSDSDGAVLRVEELLEEMKKGQSLFGGCISDDIIKRCREKEVEVYDFMKMDDVAIFNAIATAEGAIVKAMELKPVNLHDSRCLVLGYGRCGRVLARKLKGLDAAVTVCARSDRARSESEAMGFSSMDFGELSRHILRFDYIFNTVPAVVLKYPELKRLSRDACIIDIASAPGGVDQEAAGKLQVQSYLCPSLPGIYAPKSSGIRLAEKVIKLKGKTEYEAGK